MPSESTDDGKLVQGKRRSKPSQKVVEASLASIPVPKRRVGRPKKKMTQESLAAGDDLVVEVRPFPLEP